MVVSAFDDGRLTSRTQKTSASGSQLGRADYSYDPHGRMAAETDARNGATDHGYDALDRVTSITQPSADGVAARQVTKYRYNTLG